MSLRGLLLSVCTLSLFGCGSGLEELPVAYVTGKVTLNGEPVTSGRIFFYPVAESESGGSKTGKPAQGELATDGSYELSTYGRDDGAVPGKHYVTVLEAAESSKGESTKQIGFLPGTVSVVAEKSNLVNIDLRPPGKSQGDDDDDEDD